MSMSFHTKAKIPRSFFPAIGKTALLQERPVIAKNYANEKDKNATSFVLVDAEGYEMGLYFHDDGFLNFFDFTAGNWGFDDDGGLWMRKAVLSARRQKVQVLPPGPTRMPPPPRSQLSPVEKALYGMRGLMKHEDGAGVLYLPTTGLTCTSDEFKAALECHGMVVTPVEGQKAFRVTSPGELFLDQPWGAMMVYDRFEQEEGVKVTRLGEFRTLPYMAPFEGNCSLVLCFDRPVQPTDDLKQVRGFAWPLMASMSAEDESPVVKEARAAKVEKERIANLDKENAELKWQVGQLQQDVALLTACLGEHGIMAPRRPLEVVPAFAGAATTL